MKKLSLLLAAFVVAFSASATMQMKNNPSNHGMMKKNLPSLVKADRQRMANVVTDRPEGTLVKLTRGNTGGYMTASNSGVSVGNQSGSVQAVISDDGQTMWIKDILAGVSTGAWVRGELENNGTLLVVNLDQTIYEGYYEDENTGEMIPYEVKLCWGSTSVDENYIYFDFDERTTEVEFSIEGDVLTMLFSDGVTNVDPNEDASYVATGLTCYYTDNNSWAGFLDWNTTFTNNGPVVVPEIITEQPEGELVSYKRAGNTMFLESFLFWNFITVGEQRGYLNVVYAPDGKTVYLQNLLNGYDSAITSWVKGELDEEGLIHVASGQPIYFDEANMATLRLMMGFAEGTVDYSDFTYTEPSDDEILLKVEDNVITLLNSDADIAEGDETTYYVSGLAAFWDIQDTFLGSIDWHSQFTHIVAVPAVPANPENVSWYDGQNEDGWSELDFNINPVDVDGNPLDEKCLYYRIYTDNDELFTFDAETYDYTFENLGFTEDMTLMPYTANFYDLQPVDGQVYFYRTNYNDNPFFSERIGIQTVYIVDGIENASEIVYWYLPEVVPTTPANPIAINWHDSGEENGYSYFDFQIIDRDIEGNPIDLENISYSIFVDDDQIFTFDANTYYFDVADDMTEITYSIWSNGYDILSNRVYFYRTNEGNDPLFYHRIGIQVYYRILGELVGQSEIIYLDKNVAVDELNSEKTVANVRYYNVAGQELAQPEGMTIQVTTYTDGTTNTTKVVK